MYLSEKNKIQQSCFLPNIHGRVVHFRSRLLCLPWCTLSPFRHASFWLGQALRYLRSNFATAKWSCWSFWVAPGKGRHRKWLFAGNLQCLGSKWSGDWWDWDGTTSTSGWMSRKSRHFCPCLVDEQRARKEWEETAGKGTKSHKKQEKEGPYQQLIKWTWEGWDKSVETRGWTATR